MSGTHWLQLGLLVVGAYLLGAIPNGLLVGRLAGRNLLHHGSGKTGTANTLATLGRPAAVAVFALDLIKGLLVVLIARFLSWPNDAWLYIAMSSAASSAIVGHNWSVWVRLLSGKWGGGRGIVTALGAMLIVHPLVVLAAIIGAALALAVSRYMVLGAITGALVGVVTACILVAFQQITPWLLPGCIVWALLVLAGFHDNISRLLKGTEQRLGRQNV